jgi:N-6 DNA Methylase
VTSAIAASQVFGSIRVVGGLLPADMLARIADGKDISGSKPADYHVVGARSVQDDAERHWDYLKGAWRTLRTALGDDGHDPAGLATENWLLPLFEEHGFGRLHRLPAGIHVGDHAHAFPVSHRWEHVPIHLASWDADLDRRPASGGLPPQSMLQECLNRSPAHLWGILANGRHLRILRDSTSLAGSSYIDIDLEAMFDGELFAEFVMLYRLLHVSRYEISDGAAPSACRMERWRAEAIEAGARALDQLRDGVQNAIAHLGTGFLRNPANTRLRDDLDADLFKRALLRLVYRLLFWFVAEDRDVLLTPGTAENIRNRYDKYFSSRRLRGTALRRAGTTHGDIWQAVRFVLGGLGDEAGLPQLGLPGLGGIYDDTGTDQILHGLELSNEQMLAAIKSLAHVRDPSIKRYRPVDYRNLGAEELGSIYESLLELVPKWSKEERRFLLDVMPGNERKSTGSYYTPTSLIDCLLDTALDPVLDDAQKCAEIQATADSTDRAAAVGDALLSITVCDPACGSGHFLVAAARRIAKRLASVREHNPEPTLEALRAALRDVVTHCIYGVDINPMAVELAKVSLWLEALDPGKPLGFLDARIKCGNALIGATPALMAGGIPDDAFTPIEGDDRQWAASLRRANAKDNPTQDELFTDQQIFSQSNEKLGAQLGQIARAPDGSLRDVHRQAAAYRAWEESAEYLHARQVADAWCAAFAWLKTKDAPPAIVNRVFRALREQGSAAIPPATSTEIERLHADFGFFHWHLEFPDIFNVPDSFDPAVDPSTGWFGGFTCLLGNPPWERIRLLEQEFFGLRDETIATAPNATVRKRLIAALPEINPALHHAFKVAKRHAESESQFLRNSQRYPLTGRGDINTYAVFAEADRILINPVGRLGVIVPTGIATDATTQFFFKDLVQNRSLASLYDFENKRAFFASVDSRMKFSLLTIVGRDSREPRTDFAFFLHDIGDLDEPGRRFTLTPEEISLLNPNTGTSSVFRSRRDAEITLGIYRRIPVLVRENEPGGGPWQVSFGRMFHMTDDAALFHVRDDLLSEGWHLHGNIFTKESERMLPLYEGRMGHQYNHRFADSIGPREATLPELESADFVPQPEYWVSPRDVAHKLARRQFGCATALLGYRRVARNNDERTCIAALIPWGAASYGWTLAMGPGAAELAYLLASFNSIAFDYLLRNSLSQPSIPQGILEQAPVPSPNAIGSHSTFVLNHVIELTYTARDMTPFAREVGDGGEPFIWDEERRFLIRAELDALLFRLYGIGKDDIDYIMETFPIVKRKDFAKYGSYRTKQAILAVYDRMAEADSRSVPYVTTIAPPPGDGPRHPAAGGSQ